MAPVTLFNRVRERTNTATTGTLNLTGAYSSGFASFAEAGVPTGSVVGYVIEDSSNYEIGEGTFTAASSSLSRDTVLASKAAGSASTAKLALSGSADIRITALAEHLYYSNGGNPPVDVVTTADGAVTLTRGGRSVINSNAGTIHTLPTPYTGMEQTIIVNLPSTQAGSILARCATNASIDGGENTLSFATSVSTYEYAKLVATSTSQWHLLYATTGVSVIASS